MNDRAPQRLAIAVTALVAGAGAVVVLGARRGAAESARSAEFQRLTGGLGSGSATTLVPCEAAFDAGIAGPCARGLDPVPGGFSFCPHHAGPSFRR